MDKTAQWVIIATTVAGLFTTIATTLVQIYRENRNRRWDKEDRDEAAKALADRVIAEANAVAKKVVTEAHRVADRVVAEAKIVHAEDSSQRGKIVEMIKENTNVSTKAFEEANTVNRKIASLGLEHNALQREKQDSVNHAEVISETVLDTQERVKEIQKEVVGKPMP